MKGLSAGFVFDNGFRVKYSALSTKPSRRLVLVQTQFIKTIHGLRFIETDITKNTQRHQDIIGSIHKVIHTLPEGLITAVLFCELSLLGGNLNADHYDLEQVTGSVESLKQTAQQTGFYIGFGTPRCYQGNIYNSYGMVSPWDGEEVAFFDKKRTSGVNYASGNGPGVFQQLNATIFICNDSLYYPRSFVEGSSLIINPSSAAVLGLSNHYETLYRYDVPIAFINYFNSSHGSYTGRSTFSYPSEGDLRLTRDQEGILIVDIA